MTSLAISSPPLCCTLHTTGMSLGAGGLGGTSVSGLSEPMSVDGGPETSSGHNRTSQLRDMMLQSLEFGAAAAAAGALGPGGLARASAEEAGGGAGHYAGKTSRDHSQVGCDAMGWGGLWEVVACWVMGLQASLVQALGPGDVMQRVFCGKPDVETGPCMQPRYSLGLIGHVLASQSCGRIKPLAPGHMTGL